jgi:polyhydroxybutyrate depolymerase
METSTNVASAGCAALVRSWLVLLCAPGCLGHAAGEATATTTNPVEAAHAARSGSSFRLKLCSQAPVRLQAHPGSKGSSGCVVTFTQQLSDPATIAWFGSKSIERRYLVYAPTALGPKPSPVVFVFPGRGVSAEGMALYETHTRFETLADRDGFIVVYGNGAEKPPLSREKPAMPKGGFLQGCFLEHADEGVDVAYVRRIVEQLETELPVDRSRIYATGESAGGGMSFQLALEAPDLVAAIAPVVSLPFQPSGVWLHHCHAKPGFNRVSIAMVAATHDPSISYGPGPSRLYPQAIYPGMEPTRDAWLKALGIPGAPTIEMVPDMVQDDSYRPDTQRASSTIEIQRYPLGPQGQELLYYKAIGMGHRWPHPEQTWTGLWKMFGKNNQDIDFCDHAWEFFQRHPKR